MVIRVHSPVDAEYSNGLLARAVLGEDWEAIYAEGVPETCG